MMGSGHAQFGLLIAAALLSTGFLPVATARGKGGGGGYSPQVAGICGHTPFPGVCKGTAGHLHAAKHAVVDSLAVLNMQVAAFSKRTSLARKHVAAVSRTSTPAQLQALSFCDTMYMNTQDTIGAAQRAITFKDKGTTKIMLQLAVQDFQSCDRPFQQAGIPNPMEKFDAVLSEMANNCMALANMM